eukprot:248346_1
MSSQIATCDEGERSFNFEKWIADSNLDAVKHLFVKHNATILQKLTFTSVEFKALMIDPELFQQAQIIPSIMDAIQKLQNHHNEKKEVIKILISDDEQIVIHNIENDLKKLHEIEKQINILKEEYPKSQSRIKNEQYKQIDAVKQKITKSFQELGIAFHIKKENILKEVQNIKSRIDCISEGDNKNNEDEKESDILNISTNKIQQSRDYLKQQLKICDELTSNNEKRKQRKTKIINIGKEVENNFEATNNLLTENINNLQNIKCLKDGITKTPKFGARALYVNELSNGLTYYVSINNNNNIRCKKQINHKIGWTQGAIIKTVLNLRKGNIQWFLNGEKVRKTISIEKGKIYYPIIAFSGNCQYELIHVN